MVLAILQRGVWKSSAQAMPRKLFCEPQQTGKHAGKSKWLGCPDAFPKPRIRIQVCLCCLLRCRANPGSCRLHRPVPHVSELMRDTHVTSEYSTCYVDSYLLSWLFLLPCPCPVGIYCLGRFLQVASSNVWRRYRMLCSDRRALTGMPSRRVPQAHSWLCWHLPAA